jgi:peptidoglycan/xylan/chitin deacetylase (PgdA/CDA1 family)
MLRWVVTASSVLFLLGCAANVSIADEQADDPDPSQEPPETGEPLEETAPIDDTPGPGPSDGGSETEPTDAIADGPPPKGVFSRDPFEGQTLPPKTVVLTYDDGPDEGSLPIAKYLAEQKIRATFFWNGRRFCTDAACKTNNQQNCDRGSQTAVSDPVFYPESLIKEVLALGHLVASHTQNHCNLTQQSSTTIVRELTLIDQILQRNVTDPLTYFRPPYGAWNGTATNAANGSAALGKIIGPIGWDEDGGDYACWKDNRSIEDCGRGYMDRITRNRDHGVIVLLHDRPEFNVRSMQPLNLTKWLVPQLRSVGWTFRNLDEVPGIPKPR